MNELLTLKQFLTGHFPWLGTVLFWMGVCRAVLKFFSPRLQKGLTDLIYFLAADSFDVGKLLGNKWYRLMAWLLDYFLSLKLPAGNIQFQVAGQTAKAVGVIGLIGLIGLMSCSYPAPKYEPVPGASTNDFKLVYPEQKSESGVAEPPQSIGGGNSGVVMSWDSGETNVAFEIWQLPVGGNFKLSNFRPWTNTAAHMVGIPPGFYIIRTRSKLLWDAQTQSFAVSDWSRK